MSSAQAPGSNVRAVRQMAGRRAPLWVAPLVLLLLAVGCSGNNTYPIDVFVEMHYQSSIKLQEPPRKQVPKDSVPTTGKEEALSFVDAQKAEGPRRSTVNADRAKLLFAKNCAVCHGEKGDGKGKVAEYFARDKAAVQPSNLLDAVTKAKTDGELFWILTNGRGLMPAWYALLTEDERWMLAQYVKDLR